MTATTLLVIGSAALALLLGVVVAVLVTDLDTLIPPDLFGSQDWGDGEATPPWAGDECDCASCAPTEIPDALVHVEADTDAAAAEELLRRAGA